MVKQIMLNIFVEPCVAASVHQGEPCSVALGTEWFVAGPHCWRILGICFLRFKIWPMRT